MKMALALGLALASGCVDKAVEPEAPLARTELRGLYAPGDLAPIGLAIAPDGKRFVFDESFGLFRIDGDHATQIMAMNAMPVPDKPLQLPITDIVALGPDLFAVTAIGDGFLLDTHQQTLRQHFCYLPGDDGTGPRVITQRTDALAYDAANQKLYAQPVTYDAAGTLQYAQVAAYDRESGTDTDWFGVSNDVAATAMVAMPDGTLVLGQDDRLMRFDPVTSTTTALDSLARYGVESIDGLAFDAAAGALIVVDSQTDAMFDLSIERLSL